jgi:hypothetical protein
MKPADLYVFLWETNREKYTEAFTRKQVQKWSEWFKKNIKKG